MKNDNEHIDLDSINYEDLKYSINFDKKEDEKINDIKVPEPKYKVSGFRKYLKYYGVPITIMLFGVSTIAIMWALNVSIIWIFVALALTFPITALMTIFLTIRLYLDKNRIKDALLKVLTKNFIIANFMLSNKRIVKRVFKIDADGISFKDGTLRYIVERNRIWFDENSYPNLYYVPNIPTPLEFNFSKYIKHFRAEMVKGTTPDKISDEYDRPIDVMYTSESLETFRRDKFLKNFHGKTTPEIMKAFYFVSAAFAVVCIVLIIYMYVRT